MSIASTLALPIDIVISGKKAKLNPVSLYELGLAESSYIAYVTRQAYEATEGLPQSVRQEALQAAATKIADLDVDAMPVFEWVVGTSEGLCRMLAACIETADGSVVSAREAGRWHRENGGNEPGSITDKWLIASKLRSDPTEAATAANETNESGEAVSSEPSIGA